jgi:hypothetical protein
MNNITADDNQEQICKIKQDFSTRMNLFVSLDSSRILHRRIHSDPIYHFEKKERNPSDLSSSCLLNSMELNQEENLSNHSYSINYGSSYDFHADSYLSIEQSITNDINQEFVSCEIKLTETEIPPLVNTTFSNLNAHLPTSSPFWPRKGQTLDNYIEEFDSQTRTDVEKVNEFVSYLKMTFY